MTEASPVMPGDPGDDSAESRGAQLQQYWSVIVRRRGLLAICMTLVLSITLVGTLLTTPRYRATTTIEIAPKGPDILTFKDVLEVDSSFAARRDFYQTQYKIIQSRAVAERAVRQLDLVHRPEFASRKPSPLKRVADAVRSSLSGGDDDGDGPSPEGKAIEFLTRSLTVRPVRNSQLVEIAFADRDPELAADIANAVSEAYQRFRFDARYDTTGKAKEFLAGDVARVQAEVAQLERNLQDLGAEREILSREEGRQDIREQSLVDINRRYTAAVSELSAVEARYRSMNDADSRAMEAVLASPTIGHLRREQAELERRLRQMRERFDESWPPLVEVREQLETADRQLRAEADRIAVQVRAVAEADYRRVQAEVENLGRERERLKGEVQKLNRDAIEYAALREEIETKRDVLGGLVARQSETETSFRLKDTTTSSVRTVDRAQVPLEPFSPDKTRNMLLALVLGVGLGVGVVFLFEHLDNTIKDERDVERLAGLSVLGRVPLTRGLRLVQGVKEVGGADGAPAAGDATASLDLASHHEPRGPFSESFRELRTSLLLATPDRPPRHVVVTSCEPEEGKSTVALNLAQVLTQLDRRVLIVDGDLRRPRVHRSLGVPNKVGLSSYLSGNATLDGLVQSTHVPGLSVISSGPVPPNPSELLGSPGLSTLVRFFEDDERFDHIIFDSPPVLSVTDAIILATRLDSTILVTRAGVTTRDALSAVAKRLRRSRAQVIGAVLNAASDEKGYYYRRYAYGDAGERSAEPAAALPADAGTADDDASPSRRRAG